MTRRFAPEDECDILCRKPRGVVESIISYPAKMSHAAMPAHEREARGVTDTLVRLSVGLEDAEDLIGDLDRVINGAR